MRIKSMFEFWIRIKHVLVKNSQRETILIEADNIMKYIELRFIICTSKKEMKDFLDENNRLDTFSKLDDFYSHETGVSYEQFLENEKRYSDEIAKVKRIKRLYNSDRKEGFKSLRDFYVWFIEQGDSCHYCGVKESIVTFLFSQGILKSKRLRGKYFEIDRKDPNGSYTKENCVLTCYFCNNDKSDIFDYFQYTQITKRGRKELLEEMYRLTKNKELH